MPVHLPSTLKFAFHILRSFFTRCSSKRVHPSLIAWFYYRTSSLVNEIEAQGNPLLPAVMADAQHFAPQLHSSAGGFPAHVSGRMRESVAALFHAF